MNSEKSELMRETKRRAYELFDIENDHVIFRHYISDFVFLFKPAGRGISSHGRALALQARGRGIDTPILQIFC